MHWRHPYWFHQTFPRTLPCYVCSEIIRITLLLYYHTLTCTIYMQVPEKLINQLIGPRQCKGNIILSSEHFMIQVNSEILYFSIQYLVAWHFLYVLSPSDLQTWIRMVKFQVQINALVIVMWCPNSYVNITLTPLMNLSICLIQLNLWLIKPSFLFF